MAVKENGQENNPSSDEVGLYSSCFFSGELADLGPGSPTRLDDELSLIRNLFQALSESPLEKDDKAAVLKKLRALTKFKERLTGIIDQLKVQSPNLLSLDDIINDALDEFWEMKRSGQIYRKEGI